jgi:hypothetical protein
VPVKETLEGRVEKLEVDVRRLYQVPFANPTKMEEMDKRLIEVEKALGLPS